MSVAAKKRPAEIAMKLAMKKPAAKKKKAVKKLHLLEARRFANSMLCTRRALAFVRYAHILGALFLTNLQSVVSQQCVLHTGAAKAKLPDQGPNQSKDGL